MGGLELQVFVPFRSTPRHICGSDLSWSSLDSLDFNCTASMLGVATASCCRRRLSAATVCHRTLNVGRIGVRCRRSGRPCFFSLSLASIRIAQIHRSASGSASQNRRATHCPPLPCPTCCTHRRSHCLTVIAHPRSRTEAIHPYGQLHFRRTLCSSISYTG